jgi:hypothetical protein
MLPPQKNDFYLYVVMKLAVKAMDNNPKGGNLTMEKADVDLHEIYFRSRSLEGEPGLYIMRMLG